MNVKLRKGITLIELMVVISIMGIFIGGIIAIFKNVGRTNESTAVGYEIRGMLARARNTAITKNQRVDIGFDLIQNQVFSYMRRTVAFLHFEDSAGSGEYMIAGPASFLSGSPRNDVQSLIYGGRDGNCTVYGMAGGQGYIEIPYNDIFDAPHGLVFSCDFKLDNLPKSQMLLLARGSLVFVGLTEGGYLFAEGYFDGQLVHQGKKILGSPDGTSEQILVYTREPVSLRTWHHVEMSFSALGLRIDLDGVELRTFLPDE